MKLFWLFGDSYSRIYGILLKSLRNLKHYARMLLASDDMWSHLLNNLITQGIVKILKDVSTFLNILVNSYGILKILKDSYRFLNNLNES